MAFKSKLTPAIVIAAIRKRKGRLTYAAKDLKVTYHCVWDWVRQHPEIKQAVEEAREQFLDKAEDKLVAKVNKGDIRAICFTLKTLGRKRGYAEQLNLRHGGDDEAPPIKTQATISLEDLNLPPETLRVILEAVRKAKEKASASSEEANHATGTPS